MLKKVLAFIFFLILGVVVWAQSRELILQCFILFPALLLSVLFFSGPQYRPFFIPSCAVTGVLFAFFYIRTPSFSFLFLGISALLIALIWFSYQNYIGRGIAAAEEESRKFIAELDALKQKHEARLESLHHLEKQVAGLLDLYEIARDFNDYLSYEGMAEILYQRVLPELPFRELKLVIYEKNTEQHETLTRIFQINSSGFRELSSSEFTPEEKNLLEKAQQTRRMSEEDRLIVFPMNAEVDLSAFLIVSGTQQDDLAKFEVLAAYMTLQVRKVKLYQTVKDLAIRDSLTGFLVRRHFLERFHEEMERSIHYNLPLAVFILDIDHFKRYNDDYGHLAGDATLKQVASLLRENLRKVDLVSRYGGEEFVIVVPETKKNIALEIGERIRSSIARHNFKVFNDQTRVTISIGIALFPDDVEKEPNVRPQDIASNLIQYADQALYRAKEEGRNRVVLYQDLSK